MCNVTKRALIQTETYLDADLHVEEKEDESKTADQIRFPSAQKLC